MTGHEKLIELLKEADKKWFYFEDKANYLLENGVIVVDTNSVKRENLPLIQQAFNMPLDDLAKLIEKSDAQERKNPEYPPEHCFTVRECEKCGEFYEPLCEMKHICKKQNSYPKEVEE